MNEKRMAAVFKALGDENRIRIVNLLKQKEQCAAELLGTMSISQPTLSHHMKILCESGIVQNRKTGTWMYYRLSTAGINILRDYLANLTEE